MNHQQNVYDGHVTTQVRDQIADFTGMTPTVMIGDHGYRGTEEVAVLAEYGTEVIIPVNLRRVEKGSRAHRRVRRFLRQLARVEAVIGHLKAEHRLSCNFLHGVLGDEMNVILATVG